MPKYIYYNKVVLTQRVVKISSDILRKIRGKNWEKQDSWFDVTNKHVAATHNVFVYFCFVKTAFSFRKKP